MLVLTEPLSDSFDDDERVLCVAVGTVEMPACMISSDCNAFCSGAGSSIPGVLAISMELLFEMFGLMAETCGLE